jgi:hypothetical protein
MDRAVRPVLIVPSGLALDQGFRPPLARLAGKPVRGHPQEGLLPVGPETAREPRDHADVLRDLDGHHVLEPVAPFDSRQRRQILATVLLGVPDRETGVVVGDPHQRADLRAADAVPAGGQPGLLTGAFGEDETGR